MEKNDINSLREHYDLSLKVGPAVGEGYSAVWCREASRLILHLLDEVEAVPDYEYAIRWVHKPSGTTGRVGGWGSGWFGWGSYLEAEKALLDQKDRDTEYGVADDYTYKMLKRRREGEIEDV